MHTALQGRANKAKSDKKHRFRNLFGMLNVLFLWSCWPALRKEAASGIDRVTAALPDSRVVFVSINRAPEKQDRWDVVDAVNRQIEQYAAASKRVEYVDLNPVLFNRDGTSRLELFLSDGLHFRPQAYEEFTPILKPVLARALAAQAVR